MNYNLTGIREYITLRLNRIIIECEEIVNIVIPVLWKSDTQSEYLVQIGKILKTHRSVSLYLYRMMTTIKEYHNTGDRYGCDQSWIIELIDAIKSTPYYCDPSRYYTDRVRTIIAISMNFCGVITSSRHLTIRLS